MHFITVRDLRNKSAHIRELLKENKNIVLTANGKPFAIVSSTSEENLEQTLAIEKRLRAELAVLSMQTCSMKSGIDRLSLEEINTEIAAVRKK